MHKRRKSSRFRGYKTHARGFKKKARGSGHRGGFGMAGTGKRGDAKKTMIINLFGNDYFGKDRALRRPMSTKLKVLNLDDIQLNLVSLMAQGIAKDSKGSYEINLKGKKILGDGDVKDKLIITASAATASAIEKVTKAGGKILLPEAKAEVKTEKAESKPVAESKPAKKEVKAKK